MKKLNNVNYGAFAEGFLEEYLKSGFANMPKREIDLLVLRLLIEHKEDWTFEDPPTAFTLSQTLHAKRGRIRSMLDELSFRDSADELKTKARLRRILETSERDLQANKVRIQIEDGYIREYAKSVVQAGFGIVDTSFDRSIITVSGDKFFLLATEVMDEKASKKLQTELQKRKDAFQGDTQKGYLRLFLEEFVKSAGQEAGKKSIKLGAALITGGLSEISDLVEQFLKGNGKDA